MGGGGGVASISNSIVVLVTNNFFTLVDFCEHWPSGIVGILLVHACVCIWPIFIDSKFNFKIISLPQFCKAHYIKL